MGKVTVYIDEKPCWWKDCATTMVVDSKEEAEVVLWALAKQAKQEWAMFWLPMGREPFTNEGMRLAEVPTHLAEAVAARVAKENKDTMESIIYEALNTEYYQLAATLGDVPNFVELLVAAAEEWAKECYQPQEEH